MRELTQKPQENSIATVLNVSRGQYTKETEQSNFAFCFLTQYVKALKAHNESIKKKRVE